MRREVSRIIGNIAPRFPYNLDYAITLLLKNTKDEGTVICWGSAYTLARIISLSEFANTELYDKLIVIFNQEKNGGVKNQYLKDLKKAKKLKKLINLRSLYLILLY